MNGALKRARPSYDDEWEFELPVSFVDVVFLLLILQPRQTASTAKAPRTPRTTNR